MGNTLFKRMFDFLAAAGALLILLPLLAAIAALIWRQDGCPVLFRQQRVGRGNRTFRLYKFRTMRLRRGAETGAFDAGDTARVTPLGRRLRKWKLDELPQLVNVFKGDMALVGPRPEVPQWVAEYPARWQRVLQVRPGITDPATILFRNEEDMLARCADPKRTYREHVLPRKLDLYEQYVRDRSILGDFRILIQTLWAIVRRTASGTSPADTSGRDT